MKIRMVFVFALMLGMSLIRPGPARATEFEVTDILHHDQANPGNLLHSLFHSATSNGGAGGQIKAWYDLDKTVAHASGSQQYYNSTTGAFAASLLIVDLNPDFLFNGTTNEIDLDFTSANTTVIGKATVTNVAAGDGPLVGSEFLTPAGNVGDGDFSELGSLAYSFTDVTAGTAFGDFLEASVGGTESGGKVSATATITFLNKIYGIANNPNPNDVTFKANTFDGSTYISLWGADGEHLDPENNGVGGFTNSTIGTDVTFKLNMVMEVITVPEPSTLLLLVTGLVGLVGYGRRRKRRA